MAEASGDVPTFKLVLVGDGGTGKVRSDIAYNQRRLWAANGACKHDKQCVAQEQKLTALPYRPLLSSAI